MREANAKLIYAMLLVTAGSVDLYVLLTKEKIVISPLFTGFEIMFPRS